MFYLNVPENSRDFEIANVYVVDEDNDNYTCSMYTSNAPENRQPFEIQGRHDGTNLSRQPGCPRFRGPARSHSARDAGSLRRQGTANCQEARPAASVGSRQDLMIRISMQCCGE